MEWKVPTLARVANDWSMNTDTMGVYGNYYLKRAIVAQFGLGANLPEDAIYPLNLGDETGKPLDGANKYMIHFDKGAMPPVNAFWSITLYDRMAFRSRTASTASRSVAGCRSNTIRTVRSTSISRTRARARIRRRTGYRRRRAVQPDHAPLRPEVGCADRQVESASSDAGSGASERHGPVNAPEHRHLIVGVRVTLSVAYGPQLPRRSSALVSVIGGLAAALALRSARRFMTPSRHLPANFAVMHNTAANVKLR